MLLAVVAHCTAATTIAQSPGRESKETNGVSWSPVPLDTLLDVEAVVAHWQARGLVVHHSPALGPSPDLSQPQAAFPLYPLGSLLNSSQVVRWVGAREESSPGAAMPHLIACALACLLGQACFLCCPAGCPMFT